jgi:site-specific DNA recombinase
MTAEIKKARYVYYHCTGGRGAGGNTYVREEELSRLFADVVKRVQIPVDVADWIAEALRESQDDKERFHRTAVMQLQQQYLAVQAKLDKGYDDRLVGRITDELWVGKSAEWETELSAIRRETARHERASHDYAATGSKILELAKDVHNLFIRQDPREQARLLKMLVSNCRFDRGSLVVTYVKPFDLLVEGNETGIGWEAGIRTPIPWSREPLTGSRLFPSVRFQAILLAIIIVRSRPCRCVLAQLVSLCLSSRGRPITWFAPHDTTVLSAPAGR